MIINPDNRIVAAGVLLPLTEDPKLSWQYGTRHRAAIGLTELTDSHCVVVSEETGTISFAESGNLEKLGGADELQKRLEKLYNITTSSSDGKKARPGNRFGGFFSNDVPQKNSKNDSPSLGGDTSVNLKAKNPQFLLRAGKVVTLPAKETF